MRHTLLISLLLFSNLIIAQSETHQELNKPTIALLGTFHFAGSSDALSLKVDDLSSQERQDEIEELVNALAQYKSTKVILEYPFGNGKLDSLYQLYLNKSHSLTISEEQQIGFRLAAKMGHKNVYPADFKLDLPFESLITFLQENNQMYVFEDMLSDMKVHVMDVWQKAYEDLTIKEFFVFLNSDTYDVMNKNVYLEFLNKIGTETNYVGSEVVAKWWERNFKIMFNIDAIIESEDRAFVLFGQGHTAILKDFYKNRNDIRYIDILEYLKK